MSEQLIAPSPGLEWDTADRMRKSLRTSGIKVAAMAEYMGVERQTVGNWMGGRTGPSGAVLRLWALRTGVSLEWLVSGEVPHFGDTPPTKLPRLDSNQQPAGYRTGVVIDMQTRRRVA